MFEGGIRGPAVVIWPNVVEGETRSQAVINSCDFYPSLLEMLSLKPREGQQFDGISIVPALKGQPLDRAAIFTYFPHNPRVPDWLPPAVSVYHDDWKLIRIFHGGKDGAQRWKLFNLRNDIGEKDDLAAREPQRVKKLDAMIEQFLNNTAAVRPIPNPNFDPKQYRLEDEGKSQRKPTKLATRPGKNRKSIGKPVAGWRPDRDCTLAVKGGSLVVSNTGKDPHLSFLLPKPLPAGTLELQMTMTSKSRGRGQFFWREDGVNPPFFRDRSVTFDMTHDGEPHEYRFTFQPKQAVTAVRLDPGQAAGEVLVLSMKLTDKDGKPLHVWTFGRKPGR